MSAVLHVEKKRKLAPYGTWKSPITTDILSTGSIKFSDAAVSATGTAYIVETRSGGDDDGRNVIVEWPSDPASDPREVLPAPHSAKTKAHGYGGGAIAVCPVSGQIVFSNDGNGIWRLQPSTCDVTSIVEPKEDVYYADFDVRRCGRWALAIKEDHCGAADATEVENSIVVLHLATGQERVIARGADFFTHPRFSPDGSKVSFLTWCHPDMPWTGTEMYVYEFDAVQGALSGDAIFKDGLPGEISVAQPKWGRAEVLYYASDRCGTWQLQHVDFTRRTINGAAKYVSKGIRLDGLEDGDLAEPEWEIGSSTYVQLNKSTIIATWTRRAEEQLVVIDLNTGQYTIPRWPLTGIRGNAIKRLNDREFIVIGSTPTSPPSLYRISMPLPSTLPDPLRSSLAIPIDTSFYSRARHLDIPRRDDIVMRHPGIGLHASSNAYVVHAKCHAYFLPPTNPNYAAPENTLPPLIIITHGGPTSHSGPGLALNVQYFTSRGFAVALANPLGSSGYGRSYREALNSHWGVADAADVAACAEHIAKELRWADADRVGAVGGSAGGYVTLQALYSHPHLWRGGVSLYGISDVERLVAGTHKFESWYARRLLFGARNPLPSLPEMERVYRERSARYHVDLIRAPLLLLQGDADEIVPLEQAREMERAMREGGKKVKLVVFANEGHGFIKEETERRATREEQAWWVMNLVRSGKEEMEVEDRWIWIDESSGDDEKGGSKNASAVSAPSTAASST